MGPRQRAVGGMVVPRLVHQALRGEPLTVFGDGHQTRCFCHVADVVDAILRVMDHPDAVGEVFNVGSQEEISINELASSAGPRPRPASSGFPTSRPTSAASRTCGGGCPTPPSSSV
ncbi:MAG: NAD-dependent epimerase/dehydratase family protein [Actinobacteria bacterium]|nr:MAG: NAD-dependent epimerase/dehydratase family protein [Actinomycetota bacterium]